MDAGKLAQKLRDVKDDIEEKAGDSVEEGAKRTRDVAKAKVRDNDSDVTGELVSSIHYEPTNRGLVSNIAAYRVRVGAKHGNVVEFGSGVFSSRGYKAPDNPPVVDILEWIVTKGIQPTYYDSQIDLAFAIAHTIDSLGTRPHPFMRPTWFAMEPRVVRKTKSNVRKALR